MSKKHSIFKIIFVRFWCSLGSQLGSKLAPGTAQDGPQERPRAAQDGPRDDPATLRKRKGTQHASDTQHDRHDLQNEDLFDTF